MSITSSPLPGYTYPDGYVRIDYGHYSPIITFTTTIIGDVINTIIPGSLPPGLNISVNPITPAQINITLVGTPTTNGTYAMSFTVITSLSSQIFQPFNITITDGIIAVTNPPPYTFPNGVLNINYNPTLEPSKEIEFSIVSEAGTINTASLNISIPGMFLSSTISPNSLIARLVGTPTQVNTYNFSISVDTQYGSLRFSPYTLTIDLVCLASNTNILMADGTTKLIQDIHRGDIVAADPEISKTYTVSKLLPTQLNPLSNIKIVKIGKNSIAQNIPNNDLLVTPGHPIILKKMRISSLLFSRLDSVSYYDKITAEEILPMFNNDGGYYYLWDIQFDTIGSYVANGITVQSRHPRSFITPLEREFYFDKTLYSPELKDDRDTAYEYPLVNDKYIHQIV